MRTKGLIIAAGIVIVLLGVCFIEFNNKSSIVVKAPLYDVAKQVNDINNWKKWDTTFKAGGNSDTGGFNNDQTLVTASGTYTLRHTSPVALSLTKNNNGSNAITLFALTPLTDSTTVITSEEKITAFSYLTQNTAGGTSIMASFKTWMEDATKKYGYAIQLVPVKDTLILTATAIIEDSSGKNTTGALYNLLYGFIQQHQLPFEKDYFYKTVINNKQVAIGIPVYKPVSDTSNIHCLQLPRNGRLIEGLYSGSTNNISSIYTAVANFMMDKHLKQVAQPLEQYNVADTAPRPNSDIKIKVYYPIF